MKRKIAACAAMAAMITTSVSAEGNFYKDAQGNYHNKWKGFFIGYEIASGSEESAKIFGEQPLDELVGEHDIEHIVKIGVNSTPRLLSDAIGKREVEGKAYLYGWSAPNSNSEKGFGIGGELDVPFGPDGMFFVLGAQAGYGWQSVKNKTVDVSTNANKIGYITGDPVQYGNFKATFFQDTTVIRASLQLGLQYRVTRRVSVVGGYKLNYIMYDLGYVNSGDVHQSYNTISKENYANQGFLSLEINF